MKTITVIDTSVIRTGTSNAGKEWTLYDVTAVDADGAPIEEKLKSFDNLSGTVEVEVERTEHEKYGVSYMLKLPRAGGGGGGGAQAPAAGAQQQQSAGARLGPKVDDLRARVEHLEKRLDQVVQAISQLTNGRSLPEPEPQPPAQSSGAMF